MKAILFKWPFTNMYFRYQYIHVYIDVSSKIMKWSGVFLSCKCTVLCYILEYSYIAQIAMRSTSPVFAFNIQNTRSGRMFDRV